MNTIIDATIKYLSNHYCSEEELMRQQQVLREQNQNLEFKPLNKEALNLMAQWFAEPTVKQWYARNQQFSLEDIVAKYLPRIEGVDLVPSFIIYLNQKSVGFIQYYCLADHFPEGISGNNSLLFQKATPEQLAGIDLFIAEQSCRGIGLGKQIITRFIATQLHKYKAVVVDPQMENKQAIACYQKVGFLPTRYSEDSNYLLMIKMLSYRGSHLHGNTEMTNSFANKIKQAYDNIAKIWHEKRDWYIEQPSIDEMIAKLHSGAAVLDVGCGSGKPIAAYLKSHGFNVYGMDISAKQIEYAKQIIPEQNIFVADICDFSTPMQFDAIICWFTLFHIHASLHGSVLKKLHNLLKPEGLLLITFADTSHPPESEFKIIDESTIESEMFGERFYHSGQPSQQNSQLVLNTGFIILSDKIDQPGNQVILAKKETD